MRGKGRPSMDPPTLTPTQHTDSQSQAMRDKDWDQRGALKVLAEEVAELKERIATLLAFQQVQCSVLGAWVLGCLGAGFRVCECMCVYVCVCVCCVAHN